MVLHFGMCIHMPTDTNNMYSCIEFDNFDNVHTYLYNSHISGRLFYHGRHEDSPSPVHLNENNNANLSDDQQLPLVVNLSKHKLIDAQHKILSRGLKYCPNPGELDISQYQADLDKFHLRLKRYLYFFRPKKTNNGNNEIPSSDPLIVDGERKGQPIVKHRKFTNPSSWVPPPIANPEFFLFQRTT